MIERRITLGCILSMEYLVQIQSVWDVGLLESAAARKICTWAWVHFERYGVAIKLDIESVFDTRSKQMSKDEIEDIEELLEGLSDESVENPINVDYLVEETITYFQTRRLNVLTDRVNDFLSQGRVEDAEKLTIDYKPLNDPKKTIRNFIITVDDIRKNKKRSPRTLLKSWLKEGQTTIVYGNYGSGKSLLVILVAYILGLEDYENEECVIGEWEVQRPTGTLYLDGELGEMEMEERVSQFEWLGEQNPKYKMKVLSIPEYQMLTEDSFYLGERKNQLKIIQWFKENPSYKLLILDSVSTLFGLKEENDNSEWSNKINPFLRDLRALNVACLLLHHSGKDGKRGLRGASSMGAMAHNIFRIDNHPKKNHDAGEAWFTIRKEKQRAAGKSFRTFSLHFSREENDKNTEWIVTNND